MELLIIILITYAVWQWGDGWPKRSSDAKGNDPRREELIRSLRNFRKRIEKCEGEPTNFEQRFISAWMFTAYMERYDPSARTEDPDILQDYAGLLKRAAKLFEGVNENLPEDRRRLIRDQINGRNWNPITWEFES